MEMKNFTFQNHSLGGMAKWLYAISKSFDVIIWWRKATILCCENILREALQVCFDRF